MRLLIFFAIAFLPLTFVALIFFEWIPPYWLISDLNNGILIKGSLIVIFSSWYLLYTHGKLKNIEIREARSQRFPINIGLFGASISLIRLLILGGRVVSSTEYQASVFSLIIGYMAMPLVLIGWASLIEAIVMKRLNVRHNIFILIWLFTTVYIGNRSGILELLFILYFLRIIGIEYRIRREKIISLILISLLAIPMAYFFRENAETLDIVSVIQRFFYNSQVVFFALESPNTIKDILLFNQPQGIFENAFSFILDRNHISSSYRLPEYWGGDVVAHDSGHLTGYVYGWLGLIIPLFGSLWIPILLLLVKFMNNVPFWLRNNRFYAIWIYVWARMYYEFIFNLGFDSFVEKLSKYFLYSILAVAIIVIRSSVFVKRKMI